MLLEPQSEDSVMRNRLVDIQTSLAVMGASVTSTNKRMDDIIAKIDKHLDREEAEFTRMFISISDAKEKIGIRVGNLESRVDKAEGAVTGSRIFLAVLTGLIAVGTFLGFKIGG